MISFSIRKKLILIIMSSCTLAMILSAVVFMTNDITTFKTQMALELETLAKIVGDNSTAAIVFNDKDSAKEVLSSLKFKPHIMTASTLVNGMPLVTYQRGRNIKPPLSPLKSERHLFIKDRFQLLYSIMFKGKKIGDVYLEADLDEIYSRFIHYMGTIFLITLCVGVLIFLVARQLQRSISDPILELAQTTEMISRSEDYSVKIQKHDNDEIGQLFDEFNQMMRKIQSRDARLRAMYEAQKEFTSTVSHELRTPLASIKMAVDLIIQGMVGTINNEQKDVLGRAKQEVDRLKRLIDDILDLTKIESGKMKMTFQAQDMHTVIINVLQSHENLAQARGLYIKTDFDISASNAYFDHDRVVQVLDNLISNALKFTKQGGITVKTRRFLEENHLRVSIMDTGKGIADDDLPKLFKKFQQIESPEENEEGGTGLGLAICKEIIEHNGGKIWAESKPGVGSVFQFTLPLQERRELA